MPQERRRRGEQFTYKKHRELCDLKNTYLIKGRWQRE